MRVGQIQSPLDKSRAARANPRSMVSSSTHALKLAKDGQLESKTKSVCASCMSSAPTEIRNRLGRGALVVDVSMEVANAAAGAARAVVQGL